MKRIADALSVSRPHLAAGREQKSRGRYAKADDAALLERIRAIVVARPSYGYRRVTARLNREAPSARTNHKRVYRVMKQAGLLLTRYGKKPALSHEARSPPSPAICGGAATCSRFAAGTARRST